MTIDEIVSLVAPHSNLDDLRLRSLTLQATRAMQRPGCFVECGSGHGASAALLAGVIEATKSEKILWVYDTFEGLPPLDSRLDTAPGWTVKMYRDVVGSAAGSEEQIREFCRKNGPNVRVCTVKGLFADTLPVYSGGPIALLHADADWYRSTRDILANLYDHVMVGGYLVIDDYHYWHGCRKAVDEFFSANPPEPHWNTVSCSVWAQKPAPPK
jgi:O-methyltransferase